MDKEDVVCIHKGILLLLLLLSHFSRVWLCAMAHFEKILCRFRFLVMCLFEELNVWYHLSGHLNGQHRMILWVTRPSSLPGDDIKDKDMIMQKDGDLGASHAGFFSEVLQIDHCALGGDLSKDPWKLWPCDGARRALTLRKMCAVMSTLKGSQDHVHFTDTPCPLLSHSPQYFLGHIVYDLDNQSDTKLSWAKFGCMGSCRD